MFESPYALNCVDEDAVAVRHGYRNFTSFAIINYYMKKKSLISCGKILKISATKVKTSLLRRGFKLRSRGRIVGKASGNKRKLNIWGIVRKNTPFQFPWCALYVYYEKYKMTSYEISSVLGISQPTVLRLLWKYKISVRKSNQS